MQLCSGNNYPDCCKHNHLTSAAVSGRVRGGGNIISIGSVRVSADRGGRGPGDMCLFTIEKLHLAHWLQWLRVPSEILDVTDTPGAQAQASLVTFLLASSEIQDNKQRQTVVVQCSPQVPMWHVTHVCYAQSKLTNYCNFQEVCPPQPQQCLTSVKSDRSHILWVKNNNSWALSSLNSVNNRSEILWENDRAH